MTNSLKPAGAVIIKAVDEFIDNYEKDGAALFDGDKVAAAAITAWVKSVTDGLHEDDAPGYLMDAAQQLLKDQHNDQ